ncbi:restriction endonuclease [Streptomyces sp. NPDC006193]|uniref:restriction endonuclease n=1 Tax=Streptomyces sp. NPDC006193 TaxID=3155717 RepID=UPI0033AB758B
MTTPARRIRPAGPLRATGRRRFDLRATALSFGLLALALCVLGFAVRTAAEAVERRPAWVAALCFLGTAAALALRRRRRRRHAGAARAARQAAAALEAGTETALEALEAPPAQAVPSPPGPARTGPRDGDAVTAALPGATRPLPVDYDALDADEFEQAVAALCTRDGCSGVEVVGGAGDLGADVLAVAPDGRRVVIQCKRYGAGHRVGSQDLQRFGGTCYTVHEADVAVLVTTSDFTAPAAEYAEQCGIVCLDRSGLQAWSDGTGPEPWRLVDGAGEDVTC